MSEKRKLLANVNQPKKKKKLDVNHDEVSIEDKSIDDHADRKPVYLLITYFIKCAFGVKSQAEKHNLGLCILKTTRNKLVKIRKPSTFLVICPSFFRVRDGLLTSARHVKC